MVIDSAKKSQCVCTVILFPCRVVVLMGVVTVFNSVLVASVFAVMVVSALYTRLPYSGTM